MERLTNRNLPMNGYLSNSKELRDYLDRLAAYEDTGLAPEEIEDIVEMFHSYRSEEHTSELQSRFDLVCRLLLEKQNTTTTRIPSSTWKINNDLR